MLKVGPQPPQAREPPAPRVRSLPPPDGQPAARPPSAARRGVQLGRAGAREGTPAALPAAHRSFPCRASPQTRLESDVLPGCAQARKHLGPPRAGPSPSCRQTPCQCPCTKLSCSLLFGVLGSLLGQDGCPSLRSPSLVRVRNGHYFDAEIPHVAFGHSHGLLSRVCPVTPEPSAPHSRVDRGSSIPRGSRGAGGWPWDLLLAALRPRQCVWAMVHQAAAASVEIHRVSVLTLLSDCRI